MFIIWKNNGNVRVFDMQQRKALSKLKKAVKKHIIDPNIIENVRRAERLADVNWALYSLFGNDEFKEFKIVSSMEGVGET